MVWPVIGIGIGATFFAGCSRSNNRGAQIIKTLYKGFGLPDQGKIPSDQNELTKRIDGNTDSNHDGKIDNKDKNGFIETEELFEEVFSNRGKYQTQIKALYSAGLEDPLEERRETKEFIAGLFSRYTPQSDMEKAILIFRAVISSSEKFTIGNKEYGGLTLSEGGLEIRADGDCMAKLRLKYGEPLPKELFASPPKLRVSLCNEYSHLLCALFREAGIKAHIKNILKKGQQHIFAVIEINGSMYKLDATVNLFEKTSVRGFMTDREVLIGHYSNESAFLWGQRKLARSMADAEFALQIDPNDASIWDNKAIIYLTLHDTDRAVECLKKALEMDPNDGMAMCNYGALLLARGKNAEAMSYFEGAIKARPDYILPRIEKAKLLYQEGKVTEAFKCYEEAYKVDPTDLDAICTMGDWYLSQSNYNEAFKYYSEALAHHPTSADALYGKACCLIGLGSPNEAAQYLDDAIKYDSTHKEALYTRGSLYMTTGMHKKAVIYFDKAIAIDQRYVAAWNNKGNALFKLGKLKKAMECCDMAIKINPSYARPWYNKAQIYLAMGDITAANQCFERFDQLSAIGGN